MTIKAPQEIPEGAVKPKAPPAPPMRNLYGEDDRCLPLLNSERKEYQHKLKEAQSKYETAYSSALRKFTRIINESGLTEEEKQDILGQLWSDLGE